MAYTGWLSYAGTELVNDARAAAYGAALAVAGVQCRGCVDDLPPALGDEPYTTPEQDDAPWYDPAVPESAGFGGLLGMDIVGVSKGTATRSPSALVGDGSVIGALRRAHREVTIRGLMLAADDCSLSYGMAWLASALRGGGCGPAGCLGDQLCLMSCCPAGEDPEAAGTAALRTLFRAGLLEGPELLSRKRVAGGGCGGTTGGMIAEVEWTMVAGIPYLYREPVEVVPATALADLPAVDGPASQPGGCQPPGSCLDDPQCPQPDPPPLPPVPVDPCACPPTRMTARRAVSVPAGAVPAWLESVPIVTVKTGTTGIAMRCLIVRFYSNPIGLPCDPATLDGCNACAEIQIPYLSPGVTLTIDGRTERAWVDCPSGTGGGMAEPTLFGPNGGVLQWPVFDCGAALCVEISVDPRFDPGDATIQVEMVPREDAA